MSAIWSRRARCAAAPPAAPGCPRIHPRVRHRAQPPADAAPRCAPCRGTTPAGCSRHAPGRRLLDAAHEVLMQADVVGHLRVKGESDVRALLDGDGTSLMLGDDGRITPD